MRILATSCFAALLATEVGATDCSPLNSQEFLENTPWDSVVECLHATPSAFTDVDDHGYNLLMTAVVSDISPLVMDNLIFSIPEEILESVVTAKDKQGRTLGHIAAAESVKVGMLFILSKNKVSFSEALDQETNPEGAGKTPLHLAAARPDGLLFVASLLALGNVQEADGNELSPLDVALAKPETRINALLLSDDKWPDIYREVSGAEEPAKDADCSGFMTSTFFEKADEATVVACLTEETQLLAVDGDGNSALHLAAAYTKDAWIIDHILGMSGDPKKLLEMKNSSGKTALHLAAEKGSSADIALHILAWGADPNSLYKRKDRPLREDRGITALHLAASRKDDLRLAIIIGLLAFGADTMVQDVSTGSGADAPDGGRTALHRALIKPDPAKPDPAKPDPVILVALLEAQVRQENPVAVLVRWARGRSAKQLVDDEGHTALHIAASQKSDLYALRLLVKYGFSADEKDNLGNTPLMFAARNSIDAEAFLFMLEMSKKPCASSKSGVTVESALRANEKLMAVGADDNSGKTLTPLAILKQRCAE